MIKKMFEQKSEEKKPQDSQEKPIPAFLRDDYPYKAIGEELTPDQVEDAVIYEIKCRQCEMSIRSQGQNIRLTWERLQSSGCIGCGSRELVIRRVDMKKAPQQ